MRSSKDIAQRFGKRAHVYDREAFLQKEIAANLAALLPDKKDLRILEVGCGTGFLTTQLRGKYPNSHIDSTDLSFEMIAFCKEKFRDVPRLDFYMMDGQDPDFSNKYDLIVSSMAVQWFEDPVRILRHWAEHTDVYYATLGPDNFKQWRDCLAAENLSFGGKDIPDWPEIVNDENKTVTYDSAYAFLKQLKDIGAHTASKDYAQLSQRQLKQAMRRFDEQTNKQIAWHIVYGALQMN